MRREIRRILYTIAFMVLVFAAGEVAMHNWSVSLSLEMLALNERIESLHRERQELEAEIASLRSPQRLQEIGSALGLGPLPLENFVLMESAAGGGEEQP